MIQPWVPLLISLGAALLSGFTGVCMAVIAYLVRYVMTSTDRRIVSLESKTEAHDRHIASATTQTASEQIALTDLRSMVSDMRSRIEELSNQISVLVSRGTPRK